MKHAYILRGSQTGGTRYPLNFEPAIDEVTLIKFSMDLLSEEEVAQLPQNPSMLVRSPFRGGVVPELFGTPVGMKYITPKMRDYMEKLEPGVHRYYPFQLFSEFPIAGKTDHGEHYLLLPPPLIDCLVIELTQFARGFGLEGWKQGKDGMGGGGLSGRPGAKCALERSRIEGHHFWRTKVGAKNSKLTCSDEFWEGIKDELLILAPHTTCTLV